MWADLLQRLAEALRRDLPDVAVVTHADAQVPTVATVRVLRGAGSGSPVYGRLSGTQDIALELWVTDDDAAQADRRLMRLETRVLEALERPSREGLIYKIDVLGIDPDGDLFRPSLGSNLRLKVHWRKPRP